MAVEPRPSSPSEPRAGGHAAAEHDGHPHAVVPDERRDGRQDAHQHGDHDRGGAEHDHDHGHGGPLGRLSELFGGHSHGAPGADAALEGSEEGIRAVKWSLVGLAATAALQAVIVMLSGSVALLADTIHNLADALTSVPLWIAFVLGRRPPNRRYTYGYGRAEDVAGVVIVLMIALSAGLAAWESFHKLLQPEPIRHIPFVIGAAIVGFLGNEAVALYRIRVGRRINSAALVADGRHAQVDGLTSLAVLLGALGVLAGLPIADPLVGLLITLAIHFILKDAGREIWWRLMDAVEPALVEKLEHAARVDGVQDVHEVRVRWIGHTLHAEANVRVDETLTTADGHAIAEEARHAMLHAAPQLRSAIVHVDPCGHSGVDHHERTEHHFA